MCQSVCHSPQMVQVLNNGRHDLTYCIQQGSISGPILFSMYMQPLSNIIRNHNINFHKYADDTQLYVSVCWNEYNSINNLIRCIWWLRTSCSLISTDKIYVFGAETEKLIHLQVLLTPERLCPSDMVKTSEILWLKPLRCSWSKDSVNK